MKFKDLKKQYDSKYYFYDSLCKELMKQLLVLFERDAIKLAVPLEYRVKDWKSIIEKCDRYNIEPKDISEINDVAGLRIIALFKNDIEKIKEIINSTFNVSREEDITNRLSENQFGYGSIHYELKIPESWKEVPTLNPLADLNVEIQLRTVSQHAWAAASHALNYKKENDVPAPLRRTINRVAALLETADLEFERAVNERKDFFNKPLLEDEQLNTVTLEKILDKYLPEKNKDEVEGEDYSELINELNIVGINTFEELKEVIEFNLDVALEDDLKRVKKIDRELEEGFDITLLHVSNPARHNRRVFYTHTGLLRHILEIQYGEDWKKRKTVI